MTAQVKIAHWGQTRFLLTHWHYTKIYLCYFVCWLSSDLSPVVVGISLQQVVLLRYAVVVVGGLAGLAVLALLGVLDVALAALA